MRQIPACRVDNHIYIVHHLFKGLLMVVDVLVNANCLKVVSLVRPCRSNIASASAVQTMAASSALWVLASTGPQRSTVDDRGSARNDGSPCDG